MTGDPGEVSAADRELITAATHVIDQYGDGQVHTVGAALRDERGRIQVAVNLYHFTGGPCAELVVLGAVRAAGARDPQTIVAVGDAGRGVLSPCGRAARCSPTTTQDRPAVSPGSHRDTT